MTTNTPKLGEEASKLFGNLLSNSSTTDPQIEELETKTDELETELHETEKISDNNESNTDKKFTDFELECKKRGWNPEGEWSASTWDRIESMKEEISKSHKQLKQQAKSHSNMREVVAKLEEDAYNRAMAELQFQKNNAITKNDAITATNIDNQMKQLQPTQLKQIPQPVQDFLDKHNDWYTDTSAQAIKMRIFTDQTDHSLLKFNLSPAEHVARLEDLVIDQFPDYFKKENINIKQTVEGGNSTVFAKSKSKSYTVNDLDASQKKVLADFERLRVPGFNKENFIKSLLSQGA